MAVPDYLIPAVKIRSASKYLAVMRWWEGGCT